MRDRRMPALHPLSARKYNRFFNLVKEGGLLFLEIFSLCPLLKLNVWLTFNNHDQTALFLLFN